MIWLAMIPIAYLVVAAGVAVWLFLSGIADGEIGAGECAWMACCMGLLWPELAAAFLRARRRMRR